MIFIYFILFKRFFVTFLRRKPIIFQQIFTWNYCDTFWVKVRMGYQDYTSEWLSKGFSSRLFSSKISTAQHFEYNEPFWYWIYIKKPTRDVSIHRQRAGISVIYFFRVEIQINTKIDNKLKGTGQFDGPKNYKYFGRLVKKIKVHIWLTWAFVVCFNTL